LVECEVLQIRLVGDLTRHFYWDRGDCSMTQVVHADPVAA
jgi:hypothetical protein